MLQTERMDLSPARWIWYPSQRTLANTFILFRRQIELTSLPVRASGWMTADSRYLLTVNGQRVQWGPAPSDPRWSDVDPVGLNGLLEVGQNVIGVEVLYYGTGDGTWAAGKPGFLFKLELEYADGQVETVLSDPTWQTYLDRSHRPGQYRRWYLRALQEEFDARLHPYGWNTTGYHAERGWVPAMELDGAADKPALSTTYYDYSLGVGLEDVSSTFLRRRSIPFLLENEVYPYRLADSGRVIWHTNPSDWFEFRTPNSFHIAQEADIARSADDGIWVLPATSSPSDSVFVTFEWQEQSVGWPFFTIDAPEGTIIELICQESHDPAKTRWLDNHYYSWSRFSCREGDNHFETFDFESLRWAQLHIRGASRPVAIKRIGLRRRQYPWPNNPRILCADSGLQRLFDASVNTLHNSAQETIVDGMGRERQQYSGDGGHQLHAIRYAFGETQQPARYLRTFSEGMTHEGYFMDCWPGYDRLARVATRIIGISDWGPLLDHGVGFVFDCWHHYLYSGELDSLRECYPRLLKFADYLARQIGSDGLLPVEHLGITMVWIDHMAYAKQRHKQCAFNLYAAAMYQAAMAALCRAFGDAGRAAAYERLGSEIQQTTVRSFWSDERGLFINNLPWLEEEGAIALCDRSLATSILFNQCPDCHVEAAVNALADCPPEMGVSYPCNAGWRYEALVKSGRIDVVLDDFRNKWATMKSVVHNNTIQEFWDVEPDSVQQWSHCAVTPLYVLYRDILGVRPLEPGFSEYVIRPQLGDMGSFDITVHLPIGELRFCAELKDGEYIVTLTVPHGGAGTILLPANDRPGLDQGLESALPGFTSYTLEAGQLNRFRLKQMIPRIRLG